MMKRIMGGCGSLAVITQINFKVFPKPAQTRTFVCSFASLDEALAFRNKILPSPLAPMCVEIVSPRAPEYLCDPPIAHDPDSYAPEHPVAPPSSESQIVLRAAGTANVLARYKPDLGRPVTKE